MVFVSCFVARLVPILDPDQSVEEETSEGCICFGLLHRAARSDSNQVPRSKSSLKGHFSGPKKQNFSRSCMHDRLHLCMTLKFSWAWVQVEKELGLRMHPLKETYVDMATTLIQRGIAKPVAK